MNMGIGTARIGAPTGIGPIAATVVGADRRPSPMIAGLTSDAERACFKRDFISSADRRAELLPHLATEERYIVVVVDRFLDSDHQEADAGFLNEGAWQPLAAWRESQGSGHARLVAYQARAES